MNLSSPRTRKGYAIAMAIVFLLATAIMVLLSYALAELVLQNLGILGRVSSNARLAHDHLRDLLLVFGLPAAAAGGFAFGWHTWTEPDEGGDGFGL